MLITFQPKQIKDLAFSEGSTFIANTHQRTLHKINDLASLGL